MYTEFERLNTPLERRETGLKEGRKTTNTNADIITKLQNVRKRTRSLKINYKNIRKISGSHGDLRPVRFAIFFLT